MDDRRKKERIEASIPVEIHSLIHGVIYGVTINLSEGGVLVHVYEKIPLGAKVIVKFGNDSSSIMLEGVVRSHGYLDYQGNGAVGSFSSMGIKFTGKIIEEVTTMLD